jgi:site-specific DNA-adenine methylase
MNAPKKIYYDPYVGTANREWVVGDTTYIRADIVDELVEALEKIMEYAGIIEDRCDWEGTVTNKARAALAKLEESHD